MTTQPAPPCTWALCTVHGSHATWKHGGERSTSSDTRASNAHTPTRMLCHMLFSVPWAPSQSFLVPVFEEREHGKEGKWRVWSCKEQAQREEQRGQGAGQPRSSWSGQVRGVLGPGARGRRITDQNSKKRFSEGRPEGLRQAGGGITAHWGCGNCVRRSGLHPPALLRF